MFPLWDSESTSLLKSLVDSASFDADLLSGGDSSFLRDDEEKIDYLYLGGRLSEIYDEIRNPQPRGLWARWVERRSGARYVMQATLLGVAIALLLGIASLAISIFQCLPAHLLGRRWEDKHRHLWTCYPSPSLD